MVCFLQQFYFCSSCFFVSLFSLLFFCFLFFLQWQNTLTDSFTHPLTDHNHADTVRHDSQVQSLSQETELWFCRRLSNHSLIFNSMLFFPCEVQPFFSSLDQALLSSGNITNFVDVIHNCWGLLIVLQKHVVDQIRIKLVSYNGH